MSCAYALISGAIIATAQGTDSDGNCLSPVFVRLR
ncbi:hypothetical protein ABIC61_002502 [Curtobacterium sp. 1544]